MGNHIGAHSKAADGVVLDCRPSLLPTDVHPDGAIMGCAMRSEFITQHGVVSLHHIMDHFSSSLLFLLLGHLAIEISLNGNTFY